MWWKRRVLGSAWFTWEGVIGLMVGSFVGCATLVPWLTGRVRPVWSYLLLPFGTLGLTILVTAIETAFRSRGKQG
jgi:hypothetical protein